MFYIGFVSPARVDAEGRPHAVGELLLGSESERFEADLRFWDIPHYEAQWRAAVARLAEAPSTAFVTSYRGPAADNHLVWAAWREGQAVFFQERRLRSEHLERPFDPDAAHLHVGSRERAGDAGARISEWQVPLRDVLTYLLE